MWASHIVCDSDSSWMNSISNPVPVVVWCGMVWCGVPKALLPKGKGRDVYPRVKVNGLGCVCCVRAVCKCVVA